MNHLRFHILQHASFESPGYILEWINKNHHRVSFTKIYKDESLPEHSTYDVLVVMGGPMGVNDEAQYSWLRYEKTFIRESINMGKRVIGICLGSQLIANVLGAEVYPNSEKEIGYFPIKKLTTEGLLEHFPDEVMVFHWHGDTFKLPSNSTLLASSEACQNQAFLFDHRVLGLQFHLEVTDDLIESFLENNRSELKPGKYIQGIEEIKKGYIYTPTCNLLLEEILSSFVNKEW